MKLWRLGSKDRNIDIRQLYNVTDVFRSSQYNLRYTKRQPTLNTNPFLTKFMPGGQGKKITQPRIRKKIMGSKRKLYRVHGVKLKP
jgi:hypothetical protein